MDEKHASATPNNLFKRTCLTSGTPGNPTQSTSPYRPSSNRRHPTIFKHNPYFHPAVFDPKDETSVPASHSHMTWGRGWEIVRTDSMAWGNQVTSNSEMDAKDSHPKGFRRKRHGDDDGDDDDDEDGSCCAPPSLFESEDAIADATSDPLHKSAEPHTLSSLSSIDQGDSMVLPQAPKRTSKELRKMMLQGTPFGSFTHGASEE